MRRKKRIITTLTLISAIIMMTVLPLPKVEAASFTVSKSNVSIENGKSSTITINAPTHTGRLDIVSSNVSVAAVSDSSLWVENNSKTITIYAKNVGNATITIKGELFDASTEEESTFSKTINVTVTKVTTSGSTNTGNSSNGGTSSNGTQSGGTSSSNQSGSGSNTGTSSSGGQSSSNTNKPSSGSTSSPSNSNSQTSKPSNSNSTTIKPSNSSTTNTNKSEQTTVTMPVIEKETITEESTNPEENIIQQEIPSEEVQELTEESITIEDSDNVEIENVQEAKFVNSKGKIVIVSIIGGIALAMILIGIGISKNIFNK